MEDGRWWVVELVSDEPNSSVGLDNPRSRGEVEYVVESIWCIIQRMSLCR